MSFSSVEVIKVWLEVFFYIHKDLGNVLTEYYKHSINGNIKVMLNFERNIFSHLWTLCLFVDVVLSLSPT
jgi:hypothetical protein